MLENWLRPAFRYSLVAVIFLSTIVFTSGCTSGTGPKKITGIATGSAGGGTGNTGSSIGTSGKGTGSGTTVVFIGMASSMNLSGKISGYFFSSNGSSQLISGSPFTGGGSTDLAIDASEKFLFGSDLGDVTTYAIQSDGALTQVNNLTGSFGPQLDRADNTLYVLQVNVNGTPNNALVNLQINSNGTLSSTGSLRVNKGSGRLYFTPDQSRAYEPFCPGSGANILGYVRRSDGILTQFPTNAVLPIDSQGSPACPQAIAISPDGQFLVADFNAPGDKAIGLVIYSINPGGTLSEISGPFPTTAPARFAVFDPSGRFIAIAESDGVAVYQFNGAATPVLVSGTPIGGVGTEFVKFNRAGNLIFATSIGAAQLNVFTFNSGTVLVAPGAPILPGFAPATLVVVN